MNEKNLGYIALSNNLESLTGRNRKFYPNMKYEIIDYRSTMECYKVFKRIEDLETICSIYDNRIFIVEYFNVVEDSDAFMFVTGFKITKEIRFKEIYKYFKSNQEKLMSSDNYYHRLVLAKFHINLRELVYDKSLMVYNKARMNILLSKRMSFNWKYYTSPIRENHRNIKYNISNKISKVFL